MNLAITCRLENKECEKQKLGSRKEEAEEKETELTRAS